MRKLQNSVCPKRIAPSICFEVEIFLCWVARSVPFCTLQATTPTRVRRGTGQNATITLQARKRLGESYEQFLRDAEASGSTSMSLVKDFIQRTLDQPYSNRLKQRVLRAHKFSQDSRGVAQVDLLDPQRRALSSANNREGKAPCIEFELMQFLLTEGLALGSRTDAMMLLTKAREFRNALAQKGFIILRVRTKRRQCLAFLYYDVSVAVIFSLAVKCVDLGGSALSLASSWWQCVAAEFCVLVQGHSVSHGPTHYSLLRQVTRTCQSSTNDGYIGFVRGSRSATECSQCDTRSVGQRCWT